jgi:hypothetical protein
MKRWLALLFFLVATPALAVDQYDYFFLFSTQAAAEVDPVVGHYWNAANGWDLSQTFPGISVVTASAIVNGISALTGFWIMISSAGPNATLAGGANMVMSLDRTTAVLVGTPLISSAGHAAFVWHPVPTGSTYPAHVGY